MAPNRLTALQNALANPRQQKGLTYGELLLDNIIGLDNDYLSAGEQFGQAFNADPLGVMKSAALSAREGARKAVTQPLTTAEELLAGLYESGANVASTLGPEPTYLNDTLMELYGVGYDEATDEQVNRAREALFGDVLNVAGVVPVGKGAKMVVDAAVEPLQVKQAYDFFDEVRDIKYNPESAANARFFYPDMLTSHQVATVAPSSLEPELGRYAESVQKARDLLDQGVSPEVVLKDTGIMPVPLRTTTGPDYGFRLILPTDDAGIAALRPKSRYNIETVEDPGLPAGTLGEFGRSDKPGADVYDYEIRLRPGLEPEAKASTYRHERTHADLMEGDLGWNELGASPLSTYNLKQEALDTLDDLISNTTDVTVKAEYGKLRKELSDMTSYELYSRNPGEMLARLSQGDATMAKRLTAMQLLNPYLNPTGIGPRLKDAALTALFSETRPYMDRLARALPVPIYDKHANVPMDMDKAVINDPGFFAENYRLIHDNNSLPFAKGGIVKGSYLDNDPYD
jgi:hypothetical protein